MLAFFKVTFNVFYTKILKVLEIFLKSGYFPLT